MHFSVLLACKLIVNGKHFSYIIHIIHVVCSMWYIVSSFGWNPYEGQPTSPQTPLTRQWLNLLLLRISSQQQEYCCWLALSYYLFSVGCVSDSFFCIELYMPVNPSPNDKIMLTYLVVWVLFRLRLPKHQHLLKDSLLEQKQHCSTSLLRSSTAKYIAKCLCFLISMPCG